MPQIEQETNGEAKAHEMAVEIGHDIREYARDSFKPGDLESLNQLERMVQVRVEAAILDARGAFNCRKCGRFIEVAEVSCGGDDCGTVH